MSKYTMSNKVVREKLERIADAIASLDIDQEAREAVAEAVSEAAGSIPGFPQQVFRLIASDPLVPCAGAHGEPCPEGRVMRIAMHNSNAPDGRSAAWEQRAPYGKIRCVSCGAAQFLNLPLAGRS